MNFSKTVSDAVICPDLKEETKFAIIREMVADLATADGIQDASPLLDAIISRETKSSTALGSGIAFPHATTDAAERLRMVIGCNKRGIDFNSIDGQPTRIIILIVHPSWEHDAYLRCLAGVSRIMRVSDKREGIIAAKKKEEILRVFLES